MLCFNLNTNRRFSAQHIVVTLLIDSTIALPVTYQTSLQHRLGRFHIESNNDLLVANPPPWLVAYVWLELLFQLPFFFFGAYYFLKGEIFLNIFILSLINYLLDNKKVYIPSLIYGVEAATTTFACLVELFYLDVSQSDLIKLVSFYLPTLVVPVLLSWDMFNRISKWVPSEKTKAS